MSRRETVAASFDWLDVEAAPDHGPVDEVRLANMAIMVGAVIGGSAGQARLAALVHDGATPSEVICAAMTLAAEPAPADEPAPAADRREIERNVLVAIGMCCISAACREGALVRLGIAWERFMFSQDGLYDLVAVGLVKAMSDRQRGDAVKQTRTRWHDHGRALIRNEREASPRATLAQIAAKVHAKLPGGPATVGGLEQEMRKWVRLPADDPRHLAPFPHRRGPVAAESHS